MSQQVGRLDTSLNDAAPSGCARLPPALQSVRSRRFRRRGPRSQVACLHRSVPKHRRTLPGMCPGESGHIMPASNFSPPSQRNNFQIREIHLADAASSPDGIFIYLINIQNLLARTAELFFRLEIHRPHVVCIQETWLDESHKEIDIPGYEVVARRDRHAGSNRGGVLTLQRKGFNGLVFIANAKDEKRSWMFLKLGLETILIGNWYRPGASHFDGFTSLYSEMGEFFPQVSGVVLVGDLNIHHIRWLKYSRENSLIGSEMKIFCDFHGLFQIVKEPTRNDYLLDLAITDIVGAKVHVLPQIADHNAVKIVLPYPDIKEETLTHTVWHLKNANWKKSQR